MRSECTTPESVEAAIQEAKEAAGRAKEAELRVQWAIARFRAPPPLVAAEPTQNTLRLASKAEAAKALSVCAATIDRLTAQGAPAHVVGARRRYDLAELRAWLAARGPRPTTPKAKAADEDPIDVGPALRRAGLRVARGHS